MLHYVVISSLAMLFPFLMLSGELTDVFQNCYFLDELVFWGLCCISGVLSFIAFLSMFLLLSVKVSLGFSLSPLVCISTDHYYTMVCQNQSFASPLVCVALQASCQFLQRSRVSNDIFRCHCLSSLTE